MNPPIPLELQEKHCTCSIPDPVMQADSRFHCYRCSLLIAAVICEHCRGIAVLPDRDALLAKAQQLRELLAKARSFVEAIAEAPTEDTDEMGHVAFVQLWPFNGDDGSGLLQDIDTLLAASPCQSPKKRQQQRRSDEGATTDSGNMLYPPG